MRSFVERGGLLGRAAAGDEPRHSSGQLLLSNDPLSCLGLMRPNLMRPNLVAASRLNISLSTHKSRVYSNHGAPCVRFISLPCASTPASVRWTAQVLCRIRCVDECSFFRASTRRLDVNWGQSGQYALFTYICARFGTNGAIGRAVTFMLIPLVRVLFF